MSVSGNIAPRRVGSRVRIVPVVLAVVLLAAGAWGYWAQPALTDYGAVAWHQRLLHPIATNLRLTGSEEVIVSADGTRALSFGFGSLDQSADGGVRWRRVEPVRRDLRFNAVAASADGRRIVAFDGKGTILRSRDGGESWSITRIDNRELYRIALSADGMRGLITASDGGEKQTILRTDDGGETWLPLAAAPKAAFNLAMSADGLRAIATTYDREGNTTFSFTADGGTTWAVQVIAGIRVLDIAVSANGLIGFAMGQGGVLMRTSDGGATWRRQQLDTKLTLRHVSMSANGQRVAVIASNVDDEQVLQLSEDGGATWRAVAMPAAAGWPRIADVALTADGMGGLIAGVGVAAPVWRSADGGRTWQPVTVGVQKAWWVYAAAALAVVMLGMAFWPRRA